MNRLGTANIQSMQKSRQRLWLKKNKTEWNSKFSQLLWILDTTIDGKLFKFRAALSLDEKNSSSLSISATLLRTVIRMVIFLVNEGVEHITTDANDIPTNENTTKLTVPCRYQFLVMTGSLFELFMNLSVMKQRKKNFQIRNSVQNQDKWTKRNPNSLVITNSPDLVTQKISENLS